MVDEFMVCVDRLIVASACLDSANERGERDRKVDETKKNNMMKKRECRICQEEDEEDDLESPCSCNGTLKFAHRKCIQRWCNKKGDITCEICNQVYAPNYTIPPVRSNPDVITIDIRYSVYRIIRLLSLGRQSWAPHIDLRDHHHFLSLSPSEHELYQAEYDDYALANSGSLACFRSVAIILMFILLLRQILMITKDFGMVHGSSTFFNIQISVLQLAGFLLPCYVLARSCFVFQSRRRR